MTMNADGNPFDDSRDDSHDDSHDDLRDDPFDPDDFSGDEDHSGETAGAAAPDLAAAIEHYTSGLNPDQTEAVTTLTGPLIVVAGPGSGKTRVLTHRIALLVAAEIAAPWRILAVTFTNKAADEMRERVARLLPDVDPRSLWVSTFHAFCAKFLRIECDHANLPSAYTILDSSDVRTVIRDIHRDLGVPDDAASVRQSASTISRAKNGMFVRNDETMSRIADAYRSRLARLGALDFDDLLVRTKELLETNTDVRDRWQRRFSSILVDEYQDTNPVQYAIVGILASRHRNICVVGDADQAIYGFRAATPEALTNFQNDWGAETKVVKLGENYRSTPEILAVCQSIIDGNPSDLRPDLRTTNPSGQPVRVVVHPDDRDEARHVAGEVRRDAARGSVAVLMRTNAQTRSLEEALLAEGLPYAVVGALRFYERAEIKDALAYLRAVVNPADMLAFTRAAGTPKRGIGPKSLETLAAAGGNDIVATLREQLASGAITRGRAAWEDLLSLLERLDDVIETEGPVAAVRTVLDAGLRQYVRTHGGETAAERVENLDELLSGAHDFVESMRGAEADENGEKLTPRRLTELYLERIALTSSSEEAEGGASNVVQLLTAHASKGKEFDTVHVVGVEENLFPHGRRGVIGDENEERRLLFVACSRARTRLTLHRARQRYVHGDVVFNEESRFLANLPAEVEHIERGNIWGGQRRDERSGWSRTGERGDRSERWGRPGSAREPAPSQAGPAVHNDGKRLGAAEANPGTRIRHARFGEGIITDLSGKPGEETVTIAFPGQGERQFKLSLAPLEKIL